MTMLPAPFKESVPDDDIEDLHRRLRATRWPGPATVDDWAPGVPQDYVQQLCRYWTEEYNWSARQQRLNSVPQYVTEVNGLPIHFLNAPSPVAGALPLVLTHGWPGSVAEFLDVIGPLTDPVAHKGVEQDAFLSSSRRSRATAGGTPTAPGWGLERTADAWAELMSRLDYTRFVSQGGDPGFFVSSNIAARHPDRVIGIHVSMVLTPPPADLRQVTPREQRAIEKAQHLNIIDGAYKMLHRTWPQTLSHGLADFPAGQCAWILEKSWAWSDSGGDPVGVLGADRILDHIATYWFSRSAASAARMYWEVDRAPSSLRPVDDSPTGASPSRTTSCFQPSSGLGPSTPIYECGASATEADTLPLWNNRSFWSTTCVNSSDRCASRPRARVAR